MSKMRKKVIYDLLASVKGSLENYGEQMSFEGGEVWDFSSEITYLDSCLDMLK